MRDVLRLEEGLVLHVALAPADEERVGKAAGTTSDLDRDAAGVAEGSEDNQDTLCRVGTERDRLAHSRTPHLKAQPCCDQMACARTS